MEYGRFPIREGRLQRWVGLAVSPFVRAPVGNSKQAIDCRSGEEKQLVNASPQQTFGAFPRHQDNIENC